MGRGFTACGKTQSVVIPGSPRRPRNDYRRNFFRTLFSHVSRGFGFALIGAAVYIVERKGKEVDLPAQTTIRVRMDNTVVLPRFTADSDERELGKGDAE